MLLLEQAYILVVLPFRSERIHRFLDIDDFAIEPGDVAFMRGEAHGAMRWLFLFDVWHDTPAREGAFDLYDV